MPNRLRSVDDAGVVAELEHAQDGGENGVHQEPGESLRWTKGAINKQTRAGAEYKRPTAENLGTMEFSVPKKSDPDIESIGNQSAINKRTNNR